MRRETNPVVLVQKGAAQGAPSQQHSADKCELTHFDADIEEEERGRNVLLRQSSFEQCAREPETVQQTKDERDEPGSAQRNTAMALSLSYQLYGQEKNTQSDDGFDWCLRGLI